MMAIFMEHTTSPFEEYDEHDRAKWRNGADAFRRFWQSASRLAITHYSNVGELQALFLGEKPALIDNSLAAHHQRTLEQMGYVFEGDYVYEPTLVARVLQEHSETFKGYENSAALMKALGKAKNQDMITERGLVLGYPLTAVEAFVAYERITHECTHTKAEIMKAILDEWESSRHADVPRIVTMILSNARRLGLTPDDAQTLQKVGLTKKIADIYGFSWSDNGGTSPESLAKQRRLTAAFEQSGMTAIVKDYMDGAFPFMYKSSLRSLVE